MAEAGNFVRLGSTNLYELALTLQQPYWVRHGRRDAGVAFAIRETELQARSRQFVRV